MVATRAELSARLDTLERQLAEVIAILNDLLDTPVEPDPPVEPEPPVEPDEPGQIPQAMDRDIDTGRFVGIGVHMQRMDRPAPDMAAVRRLMPGIDCMRIGFDLDMIDAEGRFTDAEGEAMIQQWVGLGGTWMPLYAAEVNDVIPDAVMAGGPDALRTYISDVVLAEVSEGWRRFALWYARQPAEVQAGVAALEIINEPNVYRRCADADKAAPKGYWQHLFADHQIAIARQMAGWWHGPILTAMWAYNAQYEPMLIANEAGETPKSKLEATLGKRLIWSWHFYSDWVKGVTDLEAFWTGRLPVIEFARSSRMIMTETNAGDFRPENDEGQAYLWTRILHRLLEHGVGVMWFSGFNYGSALYWTGNVALRNPDRLATVLDAAVLVQPDLRYDYSDDTTQVRRSPSDTRTGTERGVHIHVAGPGDDTFTAGSRATFYFGGTGKDTVIISPTHSTWVYGQAGSDIIHAEKGPFAVVMLGEGDDTVSLGADRVLVYGAAGGDRFVLADKGSAVIDNFAVGEDRIDTNGLTVTAAADGDDLVLTSGAGTCRLLRRASATLAQVAPDYVPPKPVTSVPARPALVKTARQVLSGHSLFPDTHFAFGTRDKPEVYHAVCAAMGMPNTADKLFKSSLPGSPLSIRWNDRSPAYQQQGWADARTDIARFDALFITERVNPFILPGQILGGWEEKFVNESVGYLDKFARNTWTNGQPGAQVFLWTVWPALTETPWRAKLDAYEEGWHWYQETVNATAPAGKYVYIVPGHRLMMRFHDDIQAGKFPGVNAIGQLFENDGYNIHVNYIVGYAASLLTAAVAFKENPVNVPRTAVNPNVTEAQAAYIKGVVWDIATKYARAGLGGTDMGRPGIRGTTPPVDPKPVTLSVTPGTGIKADAASGTTVATYTTDGTAALSGTDAALLSAGAGKVTTKAAITGKTALSFTLTATAAGRPSATWSGSVPVGAVVVEPPVEPGTMRPLAYNTSGLTDWNTSQPFLNWIYQSRRSGASALWDWNVGASEAGAVADRAGRFVFRWEGKGTAFVNGASVVSRQANNITFDFPGRGVLTVGFSAEDAADRPRNWVVCRERDLAAVDRGELFRPEYLAIIKRAGLFRTMNWADTNLGEATGDTHPWFGKWDQRPKPSDFTYSVFQSRGMPIEVQVRLANEARSGLWLNMPHLADETYERNAARLVRDTLNPALEVRPEFGNEVWNASFPAFHWCARRSVAEWGKEDYFGYNTFCQVRTALRWQEEWDAKAGAKPKLVKVLAAQNGNAWLTGHMLSQSFGGLPAAKDVVQEVAVTSYFGGMEINNATRRADLIARIRANPAATRTWLRDNLLRADYPGSIPQMERNLAEQRTTIKAINPNLRLVCYEGGSHCHHLFTVSVSEEDLAVLTPWFIEFSYSQEMADLYRAWAAAWERVGEGPHMEYTEAEFPSKWGSWASRRWTTDSNPRSEFVDTLSSRPVWWA